MEQKLGDNKALKMNLKAEPIEDDEEKHLVNEGGKANPPSSVEETLHQQQRTASRQFWGLFVISVMALAIFLYVSPVTTMKNQKNDILNKNSPNPQPDERASTRVPIEKSPHVTAGYYHDEEEQALIDIDNYGVFKYEGEEEDEEEPYGNNNNNILDDGVADDEAQLEDLNDGEDIQAISQEASENEVQQLKALLNGESMEDNEQDEQQKLKMSGGSAPRTSHIPYNYMDANEKYLIYNPSGGMSNQEIELVNAMRMAKTLKRTLYVPMVGRHSNFPGGYSHLGYEDLFPADRIWDFQLLEKFVPVIPLNVTLLKFIARANEFNGEKHQVRFVETDYHYSGRLGAHFLKKINTKVIFLSGKAMWGGWWAAVATEETRKYLAYTSPLRSLAIRVAHAHLGPKFYSIHGRLGDEMYKWNGRDSGDIFVHTKNFQHWNKSLKVYLASDDPDNAFFKPLKQHIQVVTSRDLEGPDVDEYRNLFPTERVRNDMFGVLEKLICAMGISFLGSGFSTFSMEIRMIRAQAAFVFPELYALNHNPTMPPAEYYDDP